MKIDTNKSGSTVGRWVQKALYGSAVVGLAMSMGATSALANNGNDFKPFTPVSRIASMNIVKKVDGTIDYKESYKKARAASVYLAEYVARKRESEPSYVGSVIEGIDWKLGGTSETCIKKGSDEDDACTKDEIDEAVLKIPSPDPIDPIDPAGFDENGNVTPANTKKANVLDFCNSKYAKLAMGVNPITGSVAGGDDKYIVNGYSHAPALPCEVSIWFDKNKIYVDMLDPYAIFTLFFSDVLISDEMKDKDFAEALNAMPPQVKKEIKAIIYTALSEFEMSIYGGKIQMMDQMIGPQYKKLDEIFSVVDSSTYDSPYKHMSYTKVDTLTFSADESKKVAETIIDTLSTHHDGSNVGKHQTVITEDFKDWKGDDVSDQNENGVLDLDDALSPKSSWRSARIDPITIPGNNHIIEACSPKYAKMAMGTGLSHVNALPCEITVQIIDRTGDGFKETLVVSYLDPDFMLKSMFADISDEDKVAFGDIPGTIMTDLQNIVKAAIEIELGIPLNDGEQISYKMLPGSN